MNPQTAPNPERLIDGAALLAALFDEATRPSLRTLDRWVKKKKVPFFRIGRFVRFDPVLVRQALERDCLVTARPAKAGGAR